MQGRRVKSMDGLERPGDYVVLFAEDGGIRALWAVLPHGQWCRIPAVGYGVGGEPEWKVSVDEDGAATVEPSINMHPPHAWHGWIRHGEFIDA
jgi:hypothetical protein